MICQVEDTAGVQGSVELGDGSGVSVDEGGEESLSSSPLPPRVRPRPRPSAKASTTMTRGSAMRTSFRRRLHGRRGAGLASIVAETFAALSSLLLRGSGGGGKRGGKKGQ